jgi:hypothetical protein
MKKVILSVCFIVITLSLALPAFADPFWSYSSISSAKGVMKDANGFKMKAKATLNYNVPGAKTVKYYYPASVIVNLTRDDTTGAVNTDISISGTVDATGAGVFSITGGMQGGALQAANRRTYTVTAGYSIDSETAHPFSFTDGIDVMSGDGLMTSTAEGTLVEIYKKGADTHSAKINVTFKFVGKLDTSNDPALITVTLSGTVPEITP